MKPCPDTFPFPLVALDETASTNQYLSQLCNRLQESVAELTTVTAEFQTAGKGQRGNTWEAEEGKNLLFSVVLYPSFLEARRQFILSQIVSLTIKEELSRWSDEITIKWPNDIYWKDRKICGILIENSLSGHGIQHSIAGIGVNVNQREFLSDAPNPVSLYQLSGMCWDVEEVMELIADGIVRLMDLYDREGADMGQLQRAYGGILWRREGFHPYIDNIAGEAISAAIDGVAPDGMLTLRLADGSRRTYAFKEVTAIV